MEMEMCRAASSLEAKGALRGRNVGGLQTQAFWAGLCCSCSISLGFLIKDWRWFTPEIGSVCLGYDASTQRTSVQGPL